MTGLKNAFLAGISVSTFSAFINSAFAQQQGGNETVIVTGTRVQGMTAADSAAPITVLGTDALTRGTGSTDLRQQLGQSVPSFTAEQQAFDTANLTLSAALRGLSPNDTLVLVNGHRRHYSGNLHVDGGSLGSASDAADLSLIPSGAIDHVEVLLDGAAAQYGTDAVAGVVNIILKKKSSGGTLTAQAGDYFNRGGIPTVNGLKAAGTKYDLSYNMGLPLFDHGFVNFTIEKEYGNYTQQAGNDDRVAGLGANGEGLQPGPLVNPGSNTGSPDIPLAVAQKMPGYPRINPIIGLPEYQLTQAEVNSAYDFSDSMQVYAFGTFGTRFGKSYQNVRLPDQNIATPGSSQPCSAANPDGYSTGSSTPDGLTFSCTGPFPIATSAGFSAAPGTAGQGLYPSGPKAGEIINSGNAGSYTSPGELIQYPEGMRPQEILRETDYQYDVGLKFNIVGWDVDADVGYGKDIDKISTWNSGNRSLFIDTHTSPTNFYDGSFTGSQFTGTIDATHQFNVGMASPLTVALGVEAREDTYDLGLGEGAAYYKEGPQSFPGLGNAQGGGGNHSRKNYAGYIDLALAPIEALQIDIAGRAEHYTDFGDTQIGKITARYDFSPQFAIRGTVSTGFRAPTLAEEFYTAVNVSPTSATLQLPADSPSAKLLGLPNLAPEISTSYSAGIVAHPLEDLSVTVDGYSIAIGNRITSSATICAAGCSINAAVVFNAIAAAGVSLDPTATQPGVTTFLNAISSTTQGVDLTINYPTDLGDYGLIDWTLAGNYNSTAIQFVNPTPGVILASNPGASFFNEQSNFDFVHQSPQDRLTLTANWSLEPFGFTLRESYWGPQHNLTSVFGTAPFTFDNQAAVGILDVEARYNITDQLQFAIGGNNVFNIRPDIVPWGGINNSNYGPGWNTDSAGGIIAGAYTNSSFDPNGGYYYGRLTYNF